MKKVKVSVINPFTLRLEENGEKGDIIDLQELQKVDNTPIIEAIQNAKDQTYKTLLAKEIEQQEIKKQIALTELEKKLNQQFEDMKIEKDRLSLLVEGIDSRIQLEQKSIKSELSAIFDIEKNKLESKIKELEESLSNQKTLIELQITKAKDDEMNRKIEAYKDQVLAKQREVDQLNATLQSQSAQQTLLLEKEKNQVKSQYEMSLLTKDKAISDLKGEIELLKSLEKQALQAKDSEIRLLNEKLNGKDSIQQMQLETERTSLKQMYSEEIMKKETEIAQLKFSKSNLQIKMLGEDLEKWCNQEYESYALAGFDNCKWYKDNVSVKDAPDEKGTKADYIFEVYVDHQKQKEDKLLSVCCEMKNESPDTKNKSKNSDHYEKLEKDRVKKNCQYALLISELEWDTMNDVPIKKIPDYENMYLVRPAYFVSFLSLVKSLANKYQTLLQEHRIMDTNFKESQVILDEFESFKNTYLDKPLNSLVSEVEEIKKQADIAYKSSYKIIGLADTIISNKIAEIRVKIERFDIKRIAKKIDKIETTTKHSL